MLPIPFAAQAVPVPDPSLPAVAAGVSTAVSVAVPAGGLYAGVIAGHHVSLLSVFTAGSWEDCAAFASSAGGSLPAFDEMAALKALGVSYAGIHWTADRANGDRALAYSFLSSVSGYSHTSRVFNGLVVRRVAVAPAAADVDVVVSADAAAGDVAGAAAALGRLGAELGAALWEADDLWPTDGEILAEIRTMFMANWGIDRAQADARMLRLNVSLALLASGEYTLVPDCEQSVDVGALLASIRCVRRV